MHLSQICYNLLIMKQWTDKVIKQQVDELIELSYLLTLKDHDIKDYLSSFISACEDVISRNVSVQCDMRTIKLKVAVLKAKGMIEETDHITQPVSTKAGKITCYHDKFAEQVINFKSVITNLMADINPVLVEDVDIIMSQYTADCRFKEEKSRLLNILAVRTGYFLLLCITLYLMYFVSFR